MSKLLTIAARRSSIETTAISVTRSATIAAVTQERTPLPSRLRPPRLNFNDTFRVNASLPPRMFGYQQAVTSHLQSAQPDTEARPVTEAIEQMRRGRNESHQETTQQQVERFGAPHIVATPTSPLASRIYAKRASIGHLLSPVPTIERVAEDPLCGDQMPLTNITHLEYAAYLEYYASRHELLSRQARKSRCLKDMAKFDDLAWKRRKEAEGFVKAAEIEASGGLLANISRSNETEVLSPAKLCDRQSQQREHTRRETTPLGPKATAKRHWYSRVLHPSAQGPSQPGTSSYLDLDE